jgi:hypothetical protein
VLIPYHFFLTGLDYILSGVLAKLDDGARCVPFAGDWILNPDGCRRGKQWQIVIWAISEGLGLRFLFVVEQSLLYFEGELWKQVLLVARERISDVSAKD